MTYISGRTPPERLAEVAVVEDFVSARLDAAADQLGLAMGLVMMGAAILREKMGDAEALAAMDRIMDRLGEV